MMDGVPPIFWLVAAGALGAVIGSFLNVCIHRLPRGASIVWPSSACPHCGRELSWYENIPLLSWLALRAKCRTCKGPISVRYPFVEALTAALFVAAWWYYGPGLLLVSRLILGAALIVLFAIDLEHQLLPFAITVPGIVIGLVFSLFTAPGWIDSLIGIAVGGGVLYAVSVVWEKLRHQEALGGGDPPMLAMVGAFLGWKLVLITLLMGSMAGSVIGLALIVLRRASLVSKLPFGCFLAAGALVAATAGPPLLDWYMSFF